MSGQIKRPSKVKVGYTTFSIEWMTDDEWYASKQDDDWGGVTEHEQGRIMVRLTPGRSEDSLCETLLHEITHAVWSVRGLNHHPLAPDPETQEEYIITCQSGGLLSVLRDNPAVVAYLLNAQ